ARAPGARGGRGARSDRPGAGRGLDRLPAGLLRRHGPHGPADHHDLPRPALRPPRRHPPVRALRRLRRDAPAGAGAPPRDLHQPQAALARRRGDPRDRPRERPARVSARNRELLALVPASLLLTAGFAALFIQQSDRLSDVSLTYGAVFLGLCLAGHLVIRFTLPYADPYLFPLVAVLACFGLVVIYRLDEDLAREQAQWVVLGLALFAGTIIALRRDFRVLEQYRYTIAAVSLLLLVTPRLPGI